MMCGASRLKYNPVLAGPMTHTQPMVHTQVNFPQLQMLSSKNASADDDYDPSKFFSWSARRFNQPCGVVVPATTRSLVSYQKEGARRVWDLTRQISDQSFPPTVICGMNHKQLLKNWADSFQDPWGDSEADANSINASNHKNDLAPFLPSLHKHLEGDKATVLDKMRNVVGGFVDKLEMVSLIPKDLETPFLESGSSAVDASVLALGVFSRRQLDDDSMGSICELLEERSGKNGPDCRRATLQSNLRPSKLKDSQMRLAFPSSRRGSFCVRSATTPCRSRRLLWCRRAQSDHIWVLMARTSSIIMFALGSRKC